MKQKPVTKTVADGWISEPDRKNERSQWNVDARVWQAWNWMSPECEFCELAGALVQIVKPALVVETGTGQGFTTRRIAAALPSGSVMKTFESDDSWRKRLASLPFFDGATRVLANTETPSDDDLATADIFVADSRFALRFNEVNRWTKYAKTGSYIMVHDTGNGHPESTEHHKLGELIRSLGINGVQLPNPRGSFIGQR